MTPMTHRIPPARRRAAERARRRWGGGWRREARVTLRLAEGGGEDLIVLPRLEAAIALERAQALGIVSDEGYLTALGYRLARRRAG